MQRGTPNDDGHLVDDELALAERDLALVEEELSRTEEGSQDPPSPGKPNPPRTPSGSVQPLPTSNPSSNGKVESWLRSVEPAAYPPPTPPLRTPGDKPSSRETARRASGLDSRPMTRGESVVDEELNQLAWGPGKGEQAPVFISGQSVRSSFENRMESRRGSRLSRGAPALPAIGKNGIVDAADDRDAAEVVLEKKGDEFDSLIDTSAWPQHTLTKSWLGGLPTEAELAKKQGIPKEFMAAGGRTGDLGDVRPSSRGGGSRGGSRGEAGLPNSRGGIAPIPRSREGRLSRGSMRGPGSRPSSRDMDPMVPRDERRSRLSQDGRRNPGTPPSRSERRTGPGSRRSQLGERPDSQIGLPRSRGADRPPTWEGGSRGLPWDTGSGLGRPPSNYRPEDRPPSREGRCNSSPRSRGAKDQRGDSLGLQSGPTGSRGVSRGDSIVDEELQLRECASMRSMGGSIVNTARGFAGIHPGSRPVTRDASTRGDSVVDEEMLGVIGGGGSQYLISGSRSRPGTRESRPVTRESRPVTRESRPGTRGESIVDEELQGGALSTVLEKGEQGANNSPNSNANSNSNQYAATLMQMVDEELVSV